jgi:hypothetical protein
MYFHRLYMRKLLPYLRLRTMTQEQVAVLPEQCVDTLEKLALLKDLCSKKRKRKADALPDLFNNSLNKKRVQIYSVTTCTIIPINLMSCQVEDLAHEQKFKTQCKSIINYLDIVLKKEIFLTKLNCLAELMMCPGLSFTWAMNSTKMFPKRSITQLSNFR